MKKKFSNQIKMTKFDMTKIVQIVKTTFAHTLKSQRKSQKLLVKDIAQSLGIDPSLVSKFEAGTRIPTKAQVQQLAGLLQLEKHDLMVLWLSEQILKDYGYDETLIDAFVIAEERITYQKAQKKDKMSPVLSDMILKLDSLKSMLDTKRQNDSYKIAKALELEYTYDSNKIEGNTLTLQETHLVVNEGITINGKSMREHLEAINHSEAIGFIKSLVEKNAVITERLILQIHQLVLRGVDSANAGVYRNVQVMITGSSWLPPAPYLVSKKMEEMMEWYQENETTLHPVVLAAEMHERLVSIHPFIDGNGRTSRLLMNLILLKHGYVIANIKGELENRLAYYKALESVRSENSRESFNAFILEVELKCLQRYLQILEG